MKQNKERFMSIQTKLTLYTITMIMTCMFSFLAMFGLNQIYSRKLIDLLDTHDLFSTYFTQLDNVDRGLYRFSSSNDSEQVQLHEECLQYIDELMNSAQKLKDTVQDAVIVDFYYLADSYSKRVQEALDVLDGQAASSEALAIYEDTLTLKNIIENGYVRLWKSVDTYCDEGHIAAKAWQQKISRLIFLIAVLAISMSTVYSLHFAKGLVSMILSITHTVQSEIELLESDGEAFFERIPIGEMNHDETRTLAVSIYQMLDDEKKRIELLKENEVLTTRLQQEQLKAMHTQSQLRHARLQQIQSLVNPHFLFNILAVISDSALIEQAPNTCSSIEKLSVFLRYSLAHLESTVTIAQEVASLRNYFDIQRLRFKDRFHFEIDLSIDCENYQIPAVILQPIAENSLQHGISSYKTGGWMRCSIRKNQDNLIIEVKDNGLGMLPDKIDEIYTKIKQGLDGDISANIGLTLVHYRLQDYTGGQCQFRIESIPEKETMIQFSFPLEAVLQKGGAQI